MTSRQHWPKPDLLQQRRLELGLPLELRAVEALPRLLLKGAAPAVVLLLTPIALVLFFAHQPRRFEAEVLKLAPVEARVGNTEARLKSLRTKRAALKRQTQQIATQLVALRSGSALLEQMRRVTPQGVRLLSLAALPSKLLIDGEAEGADAFERINALALNLEALESVLLGGTTVLQATSNDDGLIQFSLEAALDPSLAVTPERLRELGSEGLARRYELLRESGIAL